MALIGGKPLSNEEAVRKLGEFRRLQDARARDATESGQRGRRWRRGERSSTAVRSAEQRERDEMREILIRNGYEHSEADVAGLQRDGMGPEELTMRARRRDTNIGYWTASGGYKDLKRS